MLALDYALAIDWQPSEDDVTRYELDGFFISPPIIAPSLLDQAWRAIEAFLESDTSIIDKRARLSDQHRKQGAPLDHVGYLYHEIPEVRALLDHAPIAATAGHLARATSIRLFHDRLLIKPTGGAEAASIGWHVDRAYWYSCTSDQMLTAWVPFVDIEVDMGPLTVLRGSHRWDETPLMATAHRTDMDTLWAEASCGPAAVGVPLLMRRGQVSFHHCRIVHGSLPNIGSVNRAALAFHLQTGDNMHRQVLLPNGRELGHTNDLLCRRDVKGQPDYSDPDIFPTLWTQSG